MPAYTLRLSEVGASSLGAVGGKNASLGEMIRHLGRAGVRVPDGFAVTSAAYRRFLAANGLEAPIARALEDLSRKRIPLAAAGRRVRDLIQGGEFPPEIGREVAAAYRRLGRRCGRRDPDVAVRSSATAEDLPGASFAGQQETFLNVRGEARLLDACRRCFASLYTDRAIAYREAQGFAHAKVALSVGVQAMIRSDRGGAGVMFTLDTDTGFPGVVQISAAHGLGESVVQGTVDPDEVLVFKPLLGRRGCVPIVGKTRGRKEAKIVYAPGGGVRRVATSRRERESFVLSDAEALRLARWAVAIERHYGRPMDIEWARDGRTGGLFIVQARPETVESRRGDASLKSYTIRRRGRLLVSGVSVGGAVASGPVCRLGSPSESARFPKGAVLVTETTDPDWVPVMKRAAAIVTDHGGRTSHAAIVSRELGLPAVVGTGRGTRALPDGRPVTVSCAEGDRGFVYEGIADVRVRDLALARIPRTRTRVMLNLADPAAAMRGWRLPADGVGLVRMEFIVSDLIKVHPMALARPGLVRDAAVRRRIRDLARGRRDPAEYFVDVLARGLARIAAVHHPRPVIVRMSDFKTNEYAALIGGRGFEPREENPMIGWRGASRYYSPDYRPGFDLECRAIRRVREEMGLDNVVVMIPFCRTLGEADRTLAAMAENGLRRGRRGLKVYVMCEIPSNVILAREFAARFDGFSIGSNDLTQLTLGVDRDSVRLAHLFDEENPAVKRLIAAVIRDAHRAGRPVGLCGQAPSDRPGFARFLVAAGIDSMSVTPDSFFRVKKNVAAAERAKATKRRTPVGV